MGCPGDRGAQARLRRGGRPARPRPDRGESGGAISQVSRVVGRLVRHQPGRRRLPREDRRLGRASDGLDPRRRGPRPLRSRGECPPAGDPRDGLDRAGGRAPSPRVALEGGRREQPGGPDRRPRSVGRAEGDPDPRPAPHRGRPAARSPDRRAGRPRRDQRSCGVQPPLRRPLRPEGPTRSGRASPARAGTLGRAAAERPGRLPRREAQGRPGRGAGGPPGRRQAPARRPRADRLAPR